MIDTSDVPSWSDEELQRVIDVTTQEQTRRQVEKTAETTINRLIWEYSSAYGREEGDEWVEPTGAHNSYASGMIVTHNGTKWVSTIPGNVWEPGVSGWRVYVEESSDTVPEFIQPTGAHDAYREGELVSFDGKVYKSILDTNAYSPEEYPSGWAEVTEEETPGEADTPPEPETVDVSEFVQPTGAHNAYKIGDRVLFEGAVYESVINANTYSPVAYPAGWVIV